MTDLTNALHSNYRITKARKRAEDLTSKAKHLLDIVNPIIEYERTQHYEQYVESKDSSEEEGRLLFQDELMTGLLRVEKQGNRLEATLKKIISSIFTTDQLSKIEKFIQEVEIAQGKMYFLVVLEGQTNKYFDLFRHGGELGLTFQDNQDMDYFHIVLADLWDRGPIQAHLIGQFKRFAGQYKSLKELDLKILAIRREREEHVNFCGCSIESAQTCLNVSYKKGQMKITVGDDGMMGSIEFLNLQPSLYTTKLKSKIDCPGDVHRCGKKCPRTTITFQYINVAGAAEDFNDKIMSGLGQLVEQLNAPHNLGFQRAGYLYKTGELALDLKLF